MFSEAGVDGAVNGGARITSKLTEATEPFSVVLGAPTAELQSLWFATQARPWNSLAVVAASPGGPALEVAQALYDVGTRVSALPLKLVDARALSLISSTQLVSNLLTPPPAGRPYARALVVLQSALAEPTSIAVSRAADAVVVCIEFDKTPLDDVRRTLELVGQDKVLGCIGVGPQRPQPPPASPPASDAEKRSEPRAL